MEFKLSDLKKYLETDFSHAELSLALEKMGFANKPEFSVKSSDEQQGSEDYVGKFN